MIYGEQKHVLVPNMDTGWSRLLLMWLIETVIRELIPIYPCLHAFQPCHNTKLIANLRLFSKHNS